jgi:cytoskeleton protein RodZ
MSEAADTGTPAGAASLDATAGAMLRAAREKRGLHIAALAASIKVSPRKLEALESDRYDELPDLTFTRALAQTMCRALKVDAEPVLARLPKVGDMPKLAQVGAGINTPFRQPPGGRDPGDLLLLRRPMFWATMAVLLAALVLALLPEPWMPWHGATAGARRAAPAAAPAASAPWVSQPIAPALSPVTGASAANAAASVPSSPMIETVHSAPSVMLGGSAAAATPAGVLTVRTRAESWIEVLDAKGQTLLSRLVQPDETVGLDGDLPLRVTIGNAAVTQLAFRGQPVDLAASTRDNVARLRLP